MDSVTDILNEFDKLKENFLNQSSILEEKIITIEEQEKQIALLEEHIRYLKYQKYGRSSERNVDQLALFNEEDSLVDESLQEQDIPCETLDEKNKTDSADAKAAKRGRRKLPENLPRVKCYHDLSADQQQCQCGCQMESFGDVTSEQLAIIPAKLYVIQHCRKKYRCRQCECGIKTAPLSPQPIPKSNASPELLAHSIVAKFLDGLPFYRQEKIWERMDITLPRATLANWTIKTGDFVQPLINLLIEYQMKGPYFNIDETPIQVLKEPDKPPDGKKYFWVTASVVDGKTIYRFHYNPSRGADVAKALLDGFTGTVMSDDCPVYAHVCNKLGLVHINCNDHARRKFNDAKKGEPKGEPKGKTKAKTKLSRASMALRFYKRLYAIEKRIRLIGTLTTEEIEAIRQEESKPIWAEFKAWIEKTIPHVNPKSKLGIALNYTYRLWDKLTAYCEDGNLPISNERAENAIRPFAIARKNFLFFDSPKGAKASENHYTLIMTAKANGLDPYYYLAYVFKELPKAETLEDVEALLPWNLDNESLKAAFNYY